MDETFDDIVGGLEDELEAPPDAPLYSAYSNRRLAQKLYAVKKDLMERNVLINPVTPEDLDKQSQYYGLLWELRRRKE